MSNKRKNKSKKKGNNGAFGNKANSKYSEHNLEVAAEMAGLERAINSGEDIDIVICKTKEVAKWARINLPDSKVVLV